MIGKAITKNKQLPCSQDVTKTPNRNRKDENLLLLSSFCSISSETEYTLLFNSFMIKFDVPWNAVGKKSSLVIKEKSLK